MPGQGDVYDIGQERPQLRRAPERRVRQDPVEGGSDLLRREDLLLRLDRRHAVLDGRDGRQANRCRPGSGMPPVLRYARCLHWFCPGSIVTDSHEAEARP